MLCAGNNLEITYSFDINVSRMNLLPKAVQLGQFSWGSSAEVLMSG
jgi:hypothetical protein